MKAPRNTPDVDHMARDCLALRVRTLGRAITAIYDDALRPLGLRVTQLNILVAAAKLGVARPTHVCRILHMDVSTLSRNLDRMKSRGWVEVVPGGDARSQPFRLTPSGRRLLSRSAPAWQRAQHGARQLLGDGGEALLKTCGENLDRETP